MSSDSHSDSPSQQSTATSKLVVHEHRCRLCFRVFHSGHALGGHQNAHRFEQILMRKIANVVKAHRNLRFIPPLNLQPTATPVALACGILKNYPRARDGPRRYHPYAKPVLCDDETRRRLLTRDLLGASVPINGAETSGQRTITASFVGDSKGEEAVDLKLKLGF